MHRSVTALLLHPNVTKHFSYKSALTIFRCFSIWGIQRCHLPATTPATYTKLILAAPCTISRGTPTKSWRTTLSPRCSILRQGKTTVVLLSSSPFSTPWQRYQGKKTKEQLFHKSRLWHQEKQQLLKKIRPRAAVFLPSLLIIFFISTQAIWAKDLIAYLVLSEIFLKFCLLCFLLFEEFKWFVKKGSKIAVEPGTGARSLTCFSALLTTHLSLPWRGADIKSQESLAVPRQLSSRHIMLLYCLCYLTLTLFWSANFNGIMVRMGRRGLFYLRLGPSETWGVFTEDLRSPTLIPIPANSKTPERNGKSWAETSLVEKPTCTLWRTSRSQEVES